MITTAQVRGARGILNWSQGDLADRTGLSQTSIGGVENGLTIPRENTMQLIQKAFEDAGIEFMANDGIRKKSGNVSFFRGRQGFIDFYQDIYNTAVFSPGTFLVNNVDEKQFLKWGKDILEPHRVRMKELGTIRYKILVQEGDFNFVASDYAEYRWLPRDLFFSVPFYVYGDKLAIILFEAEPTVIVLEYSAVTESYRRQFEAIWDVAKRPEDDEEKGGTE